MTISVRLSKDVEGKLDKLSSLTHRSKSFYIREAIGQYLEDLEEGYIALERLADPKRKLFTTEEVLEALEDDSMTEEEHKKFEDDI